MKIGLRHIRAAAPLILAAGLMTAAASQVSPAQQAAGKAAQPAPKPVNLKALPREMSGDEVRRVMRRYTQELGVPCGYCHAQDAQSGKLDFASDDNPVKQTARFMIGMTDDINNKYLAQIGDRRYAEPLTCGNCHQGQADPPNFEPKDKAQKLQH